MSPFEQTDPKWFTVRTVFGNAVREYIGAPSRSMGGIGECTIAIWHKLLGLLGIDLDKDSQSADAGASLEAACL